MKTDRIFIFGATGSGKTTLAQKLSKKLRIPYFTTDEFIYKKSDWNLKYDEKTRNKKIKFASQKKKWIIEGVHRGDWIIPTFKKANFVIILDLPRHKLFRRVILRELNRIIKRVYPRKTKFADFMKLIKWAYIYKKDNFLIHKELVKKYKKDFVILHSQKEINELEENLK